MKVLVCGGRDYQNENRVNEILNFIIHDDPIETIIEGGARGADRLGRKWAEEHGINIETYPADWYRYGKQAGYIRNAQMLNEGKPDLVIAFPGGKGTQNMVKQAESKKVLVIKIDW